jgi:flagellar basal-body rod modification protein FlgD
METAPVNNPVLEIMAQNEAAALAEDFAPNALGREEFLKLLIAQLENQDPMQPAKDTEFVAQLATFSSLEQLIGANENLQALALGQANLINAQALNLIGKEALVESNGEIQLSSGSAERIVYALPRQASSATLTIYDNNTPVRVLELETTPSGRVALDWDGLDSEGNALADGTYRFEVRATAADGEPMSVAVFKALPIDGVTFGEMGIGLVSGDQEILFEAILEIRTGQPNG